MADQAQEVTEQPVQETVQPEPFKELLGTITNSDGNAKYDSVEKALESIPHKDKHISTIEDENAKLRDELSRRKTSEEILERIQAQSSNKSVADKPQQQLDVSQLESLVESKLQETEAKKLAESNVNKVISSLQNKYGEKAEEMYQKIADDNQLSKNMLHELSSKSPDAVLRLAGVTQKVTTQPPSKLSSSIRTQSLGSSTDNHTSARVKGNTTKDLVNAWKNAGISVNS